MQIFGNNTSKCENVPKENNLEKENNMSKDIHKKILIILSEENIKSILSYD